MTLPTINQTPWGTNLNTHLVIGMYTNGTLRNVPDVFNAVTDYGATGDGSTDDTVAIQGAIDAAAVSGGEVFLPAGRYRISSNLTMGSLVTVRGVGDATIIEPTDGSADAVDTGFLMAGISNASILNLKYDGNADSLTQASAHSAVFMSGVSYCTVDGLHTENLGIDSANGGGAHIVLRAWEDGAANAGADDVTNMACRYNRVVNCTLIDGARSVSTNSGYGSFGIRLRTDWLEETNQVAFLVPIEHNTVAHNHLVGFNQNAIEIAGPITRYNTIHGNTLDKHFGDTGIEADKGASYNTFTANVISDTQTNVTGSGTFAFRCQGGDSAGGLERWARHNVFTGNVVAGMTNAAANSAGMFFGRAEYCSAVGNTFDVYQAADTGIGIYVFDKCKHLLISDNLVRNSRYGVFNLQDTFATNALDIQISGNQLSAHTAGVWFANNSTSNTYTGVVVSDNSISGPTNTCIHMGTEMNDCVIANNRFADQTTNANGVRINGSNAFVMGNIGRGYGSGTNVSIQGAAANYIVTNNYAF